MVKLIKADFDGQVMQFNDSGMFNATVAAEAMGKRLDHWLSNKETQDYMSALNTRNLGDLIITKKVVTEALGCIPSWRLPLLDGAALISPYGAMNRLMRSSMVLISQSTGA